MALRKPVGSITRGTTNPNRLRRIDRYLVSLPVFRTAANPLVVDLGFGASPITAVELLERCEKVNPNATVIGIEIDRERVERGLAIAHSRLKFALGGFEVPMPPELADRKVEVIRALNVLRQYSEAEVEPAWKLMQSTLTDNGRLIEGTCDELGRFASWVTLNRERPLTFTVALSLRHLDKPSKVQERLPKALIHHNVPGQPIHDFLGALDRAWAAHAPLGTFSAIQRWVAVCEQMKNDGWPVQSTAKRHKLGELSVDWNCVAPR